jgi:putative methyltransferase (TIGR04325 family)
MKMWKKLVVSLTPPIVVSGLQKLGGGARQQNIWNGIYETRSEMKDVDDRYFHRNEWVEAAKDELQGLLAKKGAGLLADKIGGEQMLLPLLIASLTASQKQVRVLDYGGGMGIDFVYCESMVKRMNNCLYYLLETDEVIQETKKLIKRKNLKLVSSLPKGLKGVDVVHLDSVLQYV